jgi:hypothetical protein
MPTTRSNTSASVTGTKRIVQLSTAKAKVIIVSNDRLVLIDYDGMYVDGLPVGVGNEIGHEDFRHPLRWLKQKQKFTNYRAQSSARSTNVFGTNGYIEQSNLGGPSGSDQSAYSCANCVFRTKFTIQDNTQASIGFDTSFEGSECMDFLSNRRDFGGSRPIWEVGNGLALFQVIKPWSHQDQSFEGRIGD